MKYSIYVTVLSFWLYSCHCRDCRFPSSLVKRNRHEHWEWKLKYGRDNKRQKETYIVVFHRNKFDVKTSVNSERTLHKIVFTRHCIQQEATNTFLVMHEQPNRSVRYLCIEFIFRARSLLQIKTSKMASKLDRSMCHEDRLKINPWLIVLQSEIRSQYKICSFTGGYDLTIDDWRGTTNGCNMMDVPMRVESECLKGEGITFNFRYKTCVENLPVDDAVQKAYCVTDWDDGVYKFSVLRKQLKFKNELWCLQTPLNDGDRFTAKLYIDFYCGSTRNSSAKVLTLPLKRSINNVICSDENPKCDHLRCNAYTKQTCLKTCNLCSTVVDGACNFPQDMQGNWLQRNFPANYTSISIRNSIINIDTIGTFSCLASPTTFDKSLRKIALMSTFNNGCRARYTCMAVRNYGSPSVLAYSLSQSYVWPYRGDSSAEWACKDENFKPDPSPIKDKYRSNLDTPKTTVSRAYSLSGVQCLNIDAFQILGNFYRNETCSGRLYRDCRDSSRIRFEYIGCRIQPAISDYICLATYKGRYWESIITIQNLRDPKDSRCLLFRKMKMNELFILAASECDKFSWQYVLSGQRGAFGKLKLLNKLSYNCTDIVTSPPVAPVMTPRSILVSEKQADGPLFHSTLNPLKPDLRYKIDKHVQNSYGESDRRAEKNSFYRKNEPTVKLDNNRNGSSRLTVFRIEVLCLLFVAVSCPFMR